MGKRIVSGEMQAARIAAHGKITSLTSAFKLASGNPFSIFVIPKANISNGVISQPDNVGLVVTLKCLQDDASAAFPVMFNTWTEAAIVQIDASAINLTTYDVYWGSGNDESES